MKERAIHQLTPIAVPRDRAAAALGLSESTIEALVRSGELPPPRKLSAGRVGWLWRELVEFAESRPVSDMMPVKRQANRGDPKAA